MSTIPYNSFAKNSIAFIHVNFFSCYQVNFQLPLKKIYIIPSLPLSKSPEINFFLILQGFPCFFYALMV